MPHQAVEGRGILHQRGDAGAPPAEHAPHQRTHPGAEVGEQRGQRTMSVGQQAPGTPLESVVIATVHAPEAQAVAEALARHRIGV